jgi:regulator of ribonuclease activity A
MAGTSEPTSGELICTADLSDAYSDELAYLGLAFRDFGKRLAFSGPIVTLDTFEDNGALRELLDGHGSARCALLGGNLGELAEANGWAGIVINGFVRDTLELAEVDVGIKALGTHPKKSLKRGVGSINVPLRIDGVNIYPGAWLYADADGVLIAPQELK